MQFDVIVRNGIVVSEQDELRVDVAITGDRIAALLLPDTGATGRTDIDASNCYVLPGSIDTHTHIAWPFAGTHSRDDFETGTAAAAEGGTTTVIDFVPIPRGTSPLASAEERLRTAEGRALIDYAFHPILSSAAPSVLAEIGALIRSGFASFKIYTTYPENRLDDGDVWASMQEIARHGGVAGFHAENHEVLEHTLRGMVDDGRTSVRDFPDSRPVVAELDSIRMVAMFARRLEAPVWIYHLSGGEALSAVEEARANGSRIQGETCTHYLTFDDAVFSGDDAWKFVITPPIRDATSRQELWRGLARRSLSAVASDHCAYGRDQKWQGVDDFTSVAAGAPGIGVRFPMLWSLGVADGRIDVTDLVAVASARPARALGLWPKKGVVAPGSDADLVVVDPDAEWTVPEPNQERGSDFSLYTGRRLKGRPIVTLARGVVVARNGRATGRPGHGRFVPRTISESAWRLALGSRQA